MKVTHAVSIVFLDMPNFQNFSVFPHIHTLIKKLQGRMQLHSSGLLTPQLRLNNSKDSILHFNSHLRWK